MTAATLTAPTTPAQSFNFAYSYNLAGSLTTEQYPSFHVVKTCYDTVNRVSQVGGTSCPPTTIKAPVKGTYASYFQYAPHGATLQYVLGDNLWHEPNYNLRLQMKGWTDVINNDATKQLLTATLTWGAANNNGNLQTATYVNGGSGPTFNETFQYDNVNRLTYAADSGGTSSATGGWSRTFHYDAFGNMWVDPSLTGQSLNANTTTSNKYNAYNQRTDQAYDQAGNLLGARHAAPHISPLALLRVLFTYQSSFNPN